MEWTVTTLAETTAVATEVLQSMSAGETAAVLALHGDLGAGKTAFVQQVATALGVTEPITSPTFVLMKQYPLEAQPFDQLVHIDAYRIESTAEMAPLHFSSLLQSPNTLICIEWAERIADLLPASTQHLTITLAGDNRQITLQQHG